MLLLLLLLVSADLSIEFNIENPDINTTYTDAFKISNLNYSSESNPIQFNLSYNFSNNTFIVQKSVNKYTSAKTSNITFTKNKTYIVCAELLVNDTNNSNNKICNKIIFNKTIAPPNITLANQNNLSVVNTTAQDNIPSTENTNSEMSSCNFFSIMEPTIFNDKAKLQYDVDLQNYEAEYWVEDLKGEIVKSKRTTTNDNTKSFTPKIAGAYILHIKIGDCKKTSLFAINKNITEKLEIIEFGLQEINFVIETDNYKGSGIKFFLNQELMYESDLIGTAEYKILLPELCGKNELVLQAGEQEYSELYETSCEEDTIIPESAQKITEDFELQVIQQQLADVKQEIKTLKPSTPTARLVSQNPPQNQNNAIWIAFIILALYAFADKFKKLKKSTSKDEQKGNKSKS